jgi:hypothetical protein
VPSLHLAVAPVGSVLPELAFAVAAAGADFAAVVVGAVELDLEVLAGAGVAAGAVAAPAEAPAAAPEFAAFCTPP